MDSEWQDWDSNPGSEIQIKFQDPGCKPLWFITLGGRADKRELVRRNSGDECSDFMLSQNVHKVAFKARMGWTGCTLTMHDGTAEGWRLRGNLHPDINFLGV